jgi:oxygen-independent coproporphyrinogen-3 oxidase
LLRPGTLNITDLPPLALYVHLPWCLRKCPYCDFNSHEPLPVDRPVPATPRGGELRSGEPGSVAGPALDNVLEQRYLDALCADLEASLPLVWGRRVISVFIGGGTPSLFSPAGIARLVSDIRARLPLLPGAEITLEANPGTFESERFRAYRAAGVTRLSIGVQTFSDVALRRIGRVHDAAQARAAVTEASGAFASWNIDLMYALPGQTLELLEQDLDAALSFNPPHLSIYHLTIEANTVFGARPPELPDDDTASEMLDLITERAARAGLQRYEVSAYARPGRRCAHNLNYWRFGDYLGLGAGAHGKLSFPHRVLRQVRWREPAAYIRQALAGDAVSRQDEVARRDLPFEFMLGALRLREGFALADFSRRTGLPLSAVQAELTRAQQRGLLEIDVAQGLVRPSPRGYDFLSDLQAMFLPATGRVAP